MKTTSKSLEKKQTREFLHHAQYVCDNVGSGDEASLYSRKTTLKKLFDELSTLDVSDADLAFSLKIRGDIAIKLKDYTKARDLYEAACFHNELYCPDKIKADIWISIKN